MGYFGPWNGDSLRSHGRQGSDFSPGDGSNCDHNIATSTLQGRRQAYSLLRTRGVFRIALAPPAGAEFTVVSVNNPYGCGELDNISTYRRPLPTTNLKFLSAVMWDGRESTPPTTQKITPATNPSDLLFDLAQQSVDATNGHAQASTPLTAQQQQQIVDLRPICILPNPLTSRREIWTLTAPPVAPWRFLRRIFSSVSTIRSVEIRKASRSRRRSSIYSTPGQISTAMATRSAPALRADRLCSIPRRSTSLAWRG